METWKTIRFFFFPHESDERTWYVQQQRRRTHKIQGANNFDIDVATRWARHSRWSGIPYNPNVTRGSEVSITKHNNCRRHWYRFSWQALIIKMRYRFPWQALIIKMFIISHTERYVAECIAQLTGWRNSTHACVSIIVWPAMNAPPSYT